MWALRRCCHAAKERYALRHADALRYAILSMMIFFAFDAYSPDAISAKHAAV